MDEVNDLSILNVSINMDQLNQNKLAKSFQKLFSTPVLTNREIERIRSVFIHLATLYPNTHYIRLLKWESCTNFWYKFTTNCESRSRKCTVKRYRFRYTTYIDSWSFSGEPEMDRFSSRIQQMADDAPHCYNW